MRHNMMLSGSGGLASTYFEQDVTETLGGWYGPQEYSSGAPTDDLAAGIDGTGVYVECIQAPGETNAARGRIGINIDASASKPFNVGDVFNVSGSLSWRDESKYNYRTAIYQSAQGYWLDTLQGSDDPTTGFSGAGSLAFNFEQEFLFNYNNIYPPVGSFNQDITVPSGYDKGLRIWIYYGTYEDATDAVVGPVGTLVDNLSITLVSRA